MVQKAWGLEWAGQLVIAGAYSSDFWLGRDKEVKSLDPKWNWILIYTQHLFIVA